MSTYNLSGMALASSTGTPTPDTMSAELYTPGSVYVAKNTVDLSANVTADGQLTVNAVIQALAIPKNTLVMRVDVMVVKAAVGTSGTMDVGDGANDLGWGDATVNMAATAGTIVSSVVGTTTYAPAAAMGKLYTTADTIDLVVETSTALTAGPILKVMALCVNLG